MPIPRPAALTGLAVLGALCAGTAAGVYTASIPRREWHAREVAAARSWENADLVAGSPAPELLRMTAPSYPMTVRLRVPGLVAAGACLQVREMLFGVSGERMVLLDDVSARVRDLTEAPALIAAARRQLDRFDGATLAGRLAACRAPSF